MDIKELLLIWHERGLDSYIIKEDIFLVIVMGNVYPGSSVMRERGWNPYREEEEMIQSAQAGPDGIDNSDKVSGNVWGDKEVSQGEERRRWERESWEDRGRSHETERDRRTGEDGSWQENDRRGNCRRCETGTPRSIEMPDLSRQEKSSLEQSCWRSAGWGADHSRQGQPYLKYDPVSILAEEQGMEKELRRLQSMYPQAAREILPMVEDACDQMEYEGSMMFDEMPDQNAVRRISDGIYEKVRELYPDESGQKEQRDEVLSMQYRPRRRRPPEGDFLRDLVQVMLLQEMHRRRCRHHRCRRI